MEHTTRFYEDAIAGGWQPDPLKMAGLYHQDTYEFIGIEGVEVMLLDPKAWQSVGKVRGWDNGYPDRVYEAWEHFFSNLYEGLSIEDALATIAN